MKQISIFYICFIIFLTPFCVVNSYDQTANLLLKLSANESEIGWHLERICIKGAWDITQGVSDITIAVLDSGINFSHPELAHAQWINAKEIPDNEIDDDNNGYVDDVYGWDFVGNDNDPNPTYRHIYLNSHGTFIAGIIGAKDDDFGIVGVAPNIKIMNLKIWYDTSTDDSEEEWASRNTIGEAINYAVANGADVISLSFSSKKKLFEDLSSVGYFDEMKEATEKDVIIVAAAGNDDTSSKYYPACFDFVIGVGATDWYDAKADYSNYGKDWVEFVAPGGDKDDLIEAHLLNSTHINGTYYSISGTSYSAPIVAAVIGLMKSIDSTLDLKTVRRILQRTTIDLGEAGRDDYFGYGMINATAALLETQRVITEGLPGYTFWLSCSSILIAGIIILKLKRKEKFS